jgi:hypothetical protein
METALKNVVIELKKGEELNKIIMKFEIWKSIMFLKSKGLYKL